MDLGRCHDLAVSWCQILRLGGVVTTGAARVIESAEYFMAGQILLRRQIIFELREVHTGDRPCHARNLAQHRDTIGTHLVISFRSSQMAAPKAIPVL